MTFPIEASIRRLLQAEIAVLHARLAFPPTKSFNNLMRCSTHEHR